MLAGVDDGDGMVRAGRGAWSKVPGPGVGMGWGNADDANVSDLLCVLGSFVSYFRRSLTRRVKRRWSEDSAGVILPYV